MSAQSGNPRAVLDSALVRLGRAGEVVPNVEQLCPGASGSLQRACRGFVAARRAELAGHAADAIQARDLFERVVVDEPSWAMAWYGLGVARLQAAKLGVIARSGPQHPIGVSNEAAAAYAFMEALRLDSVHILAADALARAPLGREGFTRGKERFPILRKTYSLLSPPALHAAALLEYDGGSPDTAVALLETLRRDGTFPAGLTDHLLGKAYHRAGDPKAGHDAFLRGVEDTLPITQQTYRQELAWIASPEELAEWDSIAPVARAPWMREFWARRDIEGGHSRGERLVEHLRRLGYVLEHYRLTLPRSGRNKAAGFAGSIDPYPEAAIYQFFKERPFFTGNEADEEMNEVASVVTRYELDRRVLGGDQAFRLLTSTTDVIDDRGVMYLRHGAPDKTAKTVGGEAVELWLYDLPSGPRFLAFREVNFDGLAGASQLMPTILSSSVVVRDQVCHLKPTLCSINADPRGTTVSVKIGEPCDPSSMLNCTDSVEDRMAMLTGVRLEGLQRVYDQAKRESSGVLIRRERQEGEATIELLSTTDQHRPSFTAAVQPRVQLVGLRDFGSGSGHAVAAIALDGKELVEQSERLPDGRVGYRVRVQLQAVRKRDGLRFDLDTVRSFATPTVLREGQFLTMVVALPLSAGRYAASVRVTQDDGRGAVASLPRLEVPSDGARLTVSDLVLGRAQSGARWRHRGGEVLLNPLNAFARREPATLYFQLTGLAVGESYSHRLEFYRSDDPPGKSPRLAMGFDLRATATHAEQEKLLSLERLDPGEYRIRLVVKRAGEEAEAVSWTRVVK
jgi:hypothetical protein